MEQGTLNELVLSRSVTKHIRKHNKNLEQGTGIGDDYTRVRTDKTGLVWSDGCGSVPSLAWCKAMNNFFVSGATPLGVRILAMLPEDIEESSIKEYMREFNFLADKSLVQIMGGNTKISNSYKRPSFSVSVLGVAGEYTPRPGKCRAGFQVVMTKYAGIYGNDIMIEKKQDVLAKRLSGEYISGGYFGEQMYSVVKEASIALRQPDNIYYMHDVSYGGVYGALWQMGLKLAKGVCIDHYKIPIRQETIEFSEIFDINPYMLEGTGSLLIVAEDGEKVVKSLDEMGIHSEVIGELTDGKDRYITLGQNGEKRFLAPVKGDEIYKAVCAY